MKKLFVTIIHTFLFCLLFGNVIAQSPERISYQAIIRDAGNNLISNTSVGMQISILQGSATGTEVYVETHNPITNVNGLVNIEIGAGDVVNGNFSAIDWSDGPYFIKTETDLTGGNTYTIQGTNQLLSVPYALHAKFADSSNVSYQDLMITEDSLLITNGQGILLPDGSSLWSTDGTNTFLENGNVGIGTNNPTGKLMVVGDSVRTPDDLLFSVVNNNGDTVFAVYQEGIVINVADAASPGNVGGFAVASMNSGTKSANVDLLRVTEDSVRIYIADESTKGNVGGFAVASMNSGTKGLNNEILKVTHDSTRIYVDDPDAGFSVGNTESGSAQNLMALTKENYFIGHESGVNIMPSGDSLGKFNAFLGYQTGTSITTGYRNILLGYEAGKNLTTGFDNTFIGYKSGLNADTAKQNVFIGTNIGLNAGGQINIMIGDSAGYYDTEGNNNIFMGHASGYSNHTGHHNVFLGPYTGKANIGGFANVFLGNESGIHNTNGTDNVFIGDRAGFESKTGSHNIFIGGQSGWNNDMGNNNVFIGFRAGYYESNKNDRLIIENSDADSSQALIYGDFGINSVRVNDKLGVGISPMMNSLEVKGSAFKDDGSTLWLTISDKRIKTNITDIDNSLDIIQKLRPVKYNYTQTWQEKNTHLNSSIHYSFIAQEFQEVFPESVKGSGIYLDNDPDEILTIDIHNVQIVSVKAIQELIKENQQMKTKIEKLQDEIKSYQELKADLEQLKLEVEELKR